MLSLFMVEFPYQAVPRTERGGEMGGLEIGLGVVGFLVTGLIALKIYKTIRNIRLGREMNYDSQLYSSIDSHKNKKII